MASTQQVRTWAITGGYNGARHALFVTPNEPAREAAEYLPPFEKVEVVELAPVAEMLAELVDWFDTRFPKGGKNLPGLPLYSIVEQARALLDSLPSQTNAEER